MVEQFHNLMQIHHRTSTSSTTWVTLVLPHIPSAKVLYDHFATARASRPSPVSDQFLQFCTCSEVLHQLAKDMKPPPRPKRYSEHSAPLPCFTPRFPPRLFEWVVHGLRPGRLPQTALRTPESSFDGVVQAAQEAVRECRAVRLHCLALPGTHTLHWPVWIAPALRRALRAPLDQGRPSAMATPTAHPIPSPHPAKVGHLPRGPFPVHPDSLARAP
jgi:hypothetical protein